MIHIKKETKFAILQRTNLIDCSYWKKIESHKQIYIWQNTFIPNCCSFESYSLCMRACVTKSSSVFDRKVEIAFSAGYSLCEENECV